MDLKDKTAAVFAAYGAIGSAAVAALSASGTQVFISGRDEAALADLAEKTNAAGFAKVDATDESQVSAWLHQVAKSGKKLDVVFNAIGPRASQASYGQSASQLSIEDFVFPIELIAGSQFLTARVAAEHMSRQGNGAIVFLSATLSGQFIPHMAGITAACGAIEASMRSLAAEYGPAGVRINCVRAGGMPETRTIQETLAEMSKSTGRPVEEAGEPTVGNISARPVTVAETANTITFVASNQASGIAGQVINVCAGSIA